MYSERCAGIAQKQKRNYKNHWTCLRKTFFHLMNNKGYVDIYVETTTTTSYEAAKQDVSAAYRFIIHMNEKVEFLKRQHDSDNEDKGTMMHSTKPKRKGKYGCTSLDKAMIDKDNPLTPLPEKLQYAVITIQKQYKTHIDLCRLSGCEESSGI